jgi:hypothetical protein
MNKDKTKVVLLDIGDGPEGFQIYTSINESIIDWLGDVPGLYLTASIDGASIKLGPFAMSHSLIEKLKAKLA